MDTKNLVKAEVMVSSNMDEILQKAEKFNKIMKEAKTLADEIASMNVELELKV